MERVFIEGIIYKLIKYTDKSAIAVAYSYDYGKIKLFMPKAFTNKGGLVAFVPGEIDCLKKSNSDLNKLYAFRQFPEYMSYVENPFISLRLNLLFDIFDNLYETEQRENLLWTLLKKFKSVEPGKVLIFSIYAMLKNTGLMFDFEKCSLCGKGIEGEGALKGGDYFCESCSPEKAFKTGFDVNLILRSLAKSSLYKNININLFQETQTLDMFVNHIESSTGKKIKSYKTFKDLMRNL